MCICYIIMFKNNLNVKIIWWGKNSTLCIIPVNTWGADSHCHTLQWILCKTFQYFIEINKGKLRHKSNIITTVYREMWQYQVAKLTVTVFNVSNWSLPVTGGFFVPTVTHRLSIRERCHYCEIHTFIFVTISGLEWPIKLVSLASCIHKCVCGPHTHTYQPISAYYQ